MLSKNTARFPLAAFPQGTGDMADQNTLTDEHMLSVKKTRHTHRGSQVRLPRQTLAWCFGTSLLEIA